ncbi:hypothetical protein BC936DRAFT_138011 [Jimgerdemannia flammicorona]|uniref:Uncharacterized protein n=1 Tax=Jimgerdemannia flammicorona TaxID=994334 RepID=A0A433DIL7_9FUNG|nr:hypothetical protein BC936DRAFT_138011 [Jimgerdemannia flammicorona]
MALLIRTLGFVVLALACIFGVFIYSPAWLSGHTSTVETTPKIIANLSDLAEVFPIFPLKTTDLHDLLQAFHDLDGHVQSTTWPEHCKNNAALVRSMANIVIPETVTAMDTLMVESPKTIFKFMQYNVKMQDPDSRPTAFKQVLGRLKKDLGNYAHYSQLIRSNFIQIGMLADHARDVCRDGLPSWVPDLIEAKVQWVVDAKDTYFGGVDVKLFLSYSHHLKKLAADLSYVDEKMAAYSALFVELYDSTLILTNDDIAVHKEAVKQLMESYIKHVKIVIHMVVDKTTDLCKHAKEIQLHFQGQHILYIVQGLGEIDKQLIRLQAATQCFITETCNVNDSVDWIVQLLGDICADKKHIAAPKVQKGHDAITTWCIMLQQIYGVSEAIAAAIVDHYPSVNSLLEAYEQNPQKAKDLLIGIPVAGKKRNVNRTVSIRIHTFLTGDDPKTPINQ